MLLKLDTKMENGYDLLRAFKIFNQDMLQQTVSLKIEIYLDQNNMLDISTYV